MKKTIKIIKNNILGFLIGSFLFGGIGIVIATTIQSSTVSYGKNDQTTVEEALDTLYNETNYLDDWLDPRGINVTGTGGEISFVYWNSNFSYPDITSSQVPTGSGLNGTYATREALATAYSDWENAPVYIKTTKVNGTVTGHSTCLWYNNREFCMTANDWDTDFETTKAKLKADMEIVLGITIANSSCVGGATSARCNVGDFFCYSGSVGNAICGSDRDDDSYCYVYGSGNATCQ